MAQASIEGPNKVIGFRIRLRKNYILRTLKYRQDITRRYAAAERMIQEAVEEAYALITPSVIFTTFFEEAEDFKGIQADLTLGSASIKNTLRKASAFTLMAATIGPELEKRVSQLKESDLTGAFLLDAAGSEAAEQCANFVSRILKDEAKKRDSNLERRSSPGYADWPVEASKRILEYLPFEKIGVSITASGNMTPRKSITAVQAWRS